MLLLALAFYAAMPAQAEWSRGPICASGFRISLRSTERAEHLYGTEEWVYRIWSGHHPRWSIGGRGFGIPVDENGNGFGPIVHRGDGYVVRRVRAPVNGPGLERAYLVGRVKKLGLNQEMDDLGRKALILSGSGFTWTGRDRTFFKRIHLDRGKAEPCTDNVQTGRQQDSQ